MKEKVKKGKEKYKRGEKKKLPYLGVMVKLLSMSIEGDDYVIYIHFIYKKK